MVSSIQRSGIYEGLIFRGAISIGYHYHNNNVTFSQALVKAYTAESQESCFPRVIIMSFDDRFILSALLDSLISTGYVTEEDWVYVDYLNTVYSGSLFQKSVIKEFFELHKEIIINGLRQNKNNEDVVAKYRWLANYHNNRLRSEYKEYMIFY